MLRIVLPIISGALIIFAVIQVSTNQESWPQKDPPHPPGENPFRAAVAGSGLIEPQSENIEISSPVPGLVRELFVAVGQQVRRGDALLKLDDRALQAELQVRTAAFASAEAELNRLEQLPRPEEIPVAQASVTEAEALLADREFRYLHTKKLYEEGKSNEFEFVTAEQAYKLAQAQLARAQAELKLLEAGSWESDRQVARAAVEQARAAVEQVKTELDRLIVRATVDGEILQVDVRPGEFVATPPLQPLIVLGDLSKLHARVDIDENDIPRLNTAASAKAFARGAPQEAFTLHFVRIEPYVIPKRSLTGQTFERVDTRVLQLIYVIDAPPGKLFVGQQVDVFIDSPP
ncbi:MAG: Inner membrane protein YibH [Phycisphaerae bacterium]|nr:Inner membrane protein YibH [Phycisphaerae bacterium]